MGRTVEFASRIFAERALALALTALFLLVLFGSVPGGRVPAALAFLVLARIATLFHESLRRSPTPAEWEQLYHDLRDEYRGLDDETLEDVAAELGLDGCTDPERLARADIELQQLHASPRREGSDRLAEGVGVAVFCLLVPFDVALYTRDIVSLRSGDSLASVAVAVACVGLYLWPHSWVASEGRADRQRLWWILPVVPAVAFAYLGITTNHTYLDWRRDDRLQLKAERVLALRSNVTAEHYAEWVFDYARELELKGDPELAIAYYRKGLHLAPHSNSARARLRVLERPTEEGGGPAGSAWGSFTADPRPRFAGLAPAAIAGLALWEAPEPTGTTRECRIGSLRRSVTETTIVVIRIGEVPSAITNAIRYALENELDVAVCMAPEVVPLPPASRFRGVLVGRQWSGPTLIDASLPYLQELQNSPIKTLLLTGVDIYSDESNYVFSMTYPWGATVSYARYGDVDSELGEVRHSAAKQSLGALLKSFGLPTSPDPHCVTSYSNGPVQFAAKGNRPNANSYLAFRERVDAQNERWKRFRSDLYRQQRPTGR